MGTLNLRKIAHSLGLTRTVRKELSDIISEQAIVTDKFEEKGVYPAYRESGRLGGMSEPVRDYYVNHFVKFAGESRTFEANNKLFYLTLHVGDRVNLTYREISSVVMDYADNDFSQKKELERQIAGYEIESAEKILN